MTINQYTHHQWFVGINSHLDICVKDLPFDLTKLGSEIGGESFPTRAATFRCNWAVFAKAWYEPSS